MIDPEVLWEAAKEIRSIDGVNSVVYDESGKNWLVNSFVFKQSDYSTLGLQWIDGFDRMIEAIRKKFDPQHS